MKILLLHGWHSAPGGVKPTNLTDHGHEVLNPALDYDDFALTVKTAQEEFDMSGGSTWHTRKMEMLKMKIEEVESLTSTLDSQQGCNACMKTVVEAVTESRHKSGTQQ